MIWVSRGLRTQLVTGIVLICAGEALEWLVGLHVISVTSGRLDPCLILLTMLGWDRLLLFCFKAGHMFQLPSIHPSQPGFC